MTFSVILAKELWYYHAMNKVYRVYIKGRASGKLTGFEENFTCLVWPSREKIFLKRSLVQNILPIFENQLPSCGVHK